MKNLDAGWMYGYCLLASICGLIALIAFGKVEEKTSYGLQWLVAALVLITQQWASWKFGKPEKKDSEEQK